MICTEAFLRVDKGAVGPGEELFAQYDVHGCGDMTKPPPELGTLVRHETGEMPVVQNLGPDGGVVWISGFRCDGRIRVNEIPRKLGRCVSLEGSKGGRGRIPTAKELVFLNRKKLGPQLLPSSRLTKGTIIALTRMAVAAPEEGIPDTFFDKPWYVRAGRLVRFDGEHEFNPGPNHVIVEHPANNRYVEVIRSSIVGAGFGLRLRRLPVNMAGCVARIEGHASHEEPLDRRYTIAVKHEGKLVYVTADATCAWAFANSGTMESSDGVTFVKVVCCKDGSSVVVGCREGGTLEGLRCFIGADEIWPSDLAKLHDTNDTVLVSCISMPEKDDPLYFMTQINCSFDPGCS